MWLTAFLDHPLADAARAERFWAAATGTTPSSDRGERAEFASFLPADGDAHLRVQRLAAGEPGVHLDLHVRDPRALADRAVALGAVEVADHGYVVLRSPGGLAHCAVGGAESRRSAPLVADDGHASLLGLATDDRPAEVARLVGLGAVEVGGGPRWATLADPVGRAFCVTDRDPRTGRLPS